MRTFREPALALIAFAAPLVQLILVSLTDLTPEAQAAANAAIVAVAGAVTAWLVDEEKLVASLAGAVQAVAALLAVHAAGLDAEQATALSGALALAVGAFVRTQVTANTPAPAVRSGQWPDEYSDEPPWTPRPAEMAYRPEPDPEPEPLAETGVMDIAEPGIASPPQPLTVDRLTARLRDEQRDRPY